MPHEWYLFGESTTNNGFAGIAAKAGQPDVYTIAGDTVTLRDLKSPFFIGGIGTAETKPNGFRFKGSLSYSGVYNYVQGMRQGGRPMDGFNMIPTPFQPKEVITGEGSNTNTAEEIIMALLFSYGTPHRYPMNELEALQMIPRAKKIWRPQFSVTPAGAVTSGSGVVTLDSASQEDYWINKDSQYYILGVRPHLVQNAGVLQFYGNLPLGDFAAHCIPMADGADEVLFNSGGPSFAYEPIGPFSMATPPKVAMFSIEAAATTFSAIIAEI